MNRRAWKERCLIGSGSRPFDDRNLWSLPALVDVPEHGPCRSPHSVKSKVVDSIVVGEKVDPDDLIGAAEVQAILKLSHSSSVTTYLRRYADFPRPMVDLDASRIRLWRRQDIVQWHEQREARS